MSTRKQSQYLKANPKALKKIQHVVVLMLENRSFDNLLGWLYDEEEPARDQHFEGLHSSLWNPLNLVDSNGVKFVEKVYVKKNGEPIKRGFHQVKVASTDFSQPNPDPGEGYNNTNEQLFGYYDIGDLYPPEPTNMGFVNNYKNAILYGSYVFGDGPADPRQIMQCYTPEQTPVLSTLAKQYAVCDHWFCSVPSQTLPNRDFFHAATSTGHVNNHPDANCDAPTIFNQIQDAIEDGRKDLSWRVYSGSHKKKLFSLTRLIMTKLHAPQFDKNFESIKQFYRDAARGNLPSYSFLEPQFSGSEQNDQHPNADIRPGEQLIADVYNALIASPQWKNTLLVITYDEHGGCYDHVAPPKATPPEGGRYGESGQDGFRFNRLGLRVPTVVVSPWIEKGTIARPAGWNPYDHTSVIATIRNAFGLNGALTQRDRSAPDLSGILNRKTMRRDKPKVRPLSYKKSKNVQINDLHAIAESVLEKLTGVSRLDEEGLIDFIYTQYESYFKRFGLNK